MTLREDWGTGKIKKRLKKKEEEKEYRECHLCEKKYEVKRFWQRFCSTKCRMDFVKQERQKALEEFRTGEK